MQFLDEDDTPVTPNASTVTWCLTDKNGNVINSRLNVALVSALSMTVKMSGLDLAISGNPDKIITRNGVKINQYERHVAVKGEIDSTLGTDLPVTKGFIFYIEDIVCIP